MKYKCYFCQKETTHRDKYYGCMHTHNPRGKIMHVRHFYSNIGGMHFTLSQVIWNFKHKRRTYEMMYDFFPTHSAHLYRRSGGVTKWIASFNFIPEWTPDNCQEKISKVLVFA